MVLTSRKLTWNLCNELYIEKLVVYINCSVKVQLKLEVFLNKFKKNIFLLFLEFLSIVLEETKNCMIEQQIQQKVQTDMLQARMHENLVPERRGFFANLFRNYL